MCEKAFMCRANDCTVHLFNDDGSMLPGVTVALHRGMAYCSRHAREITEVETGLGPAIMELHAHALLVSSTPEVSNDYYEALYRVRRLRSMEKNLFGG